MRERIFSSQLEEWLKSKKPKTIGSLTDIFAERSFAIVVFILMFFPALPLPTAAHPLELITMLISLEMIAGRRKLWLPKFVLKRNLGERTIHKAIPFIMKRLRWFEKFSRPRLRSVIDNALFLRFAGLCIFVFTVFAFISLPFSGLDTLPSLGVVIIALSLILGDMSIFIIGLFLGTLGAVLTIALGAATLKAFKHFI